VGIHFSESSSKKSDRWRRSQISNQNIYLQCNSEFYAKITCKSGLRLKTPNLPITTQRYHLKIDIQEIQKPQEHNTKGQKQGKINETKIGYEKSTNNLRMEWEIEIN
jgi:hypothetical protein